MSLSLKPIGPLVLTKNSGQKGFTLTEVLVAMVVLSIGLLGVAGLQAKSLGDGTSATLRSQATLYAYDIIERMRANPSEALKSASPYQIAPGSTPSLSLPAVVYNDLADWLAAVDDLPSGQGGVSVSVMSPGQVKASIQIKWLEKGVDQFIEVETLL